MIKNEYFCLENLEIIQLPAQDDSSPITPMPAAEVDLVEETYFIQNV
ncbi:hypothetical protein MM221_11720 [Salipaludibacillus sp. LMS25]|jgi:hypothetical protein|nr:hypothetical protein [Salipaludibacillus sp. LMS25]UTR13314.1 hypothetical protein MM221_11720 [Salipaludibacillus sp. LMS25]